MSSYIESLESVISIYTQQGTIYNGIPIDEILEEIRDNTTGVVDIMFDGSLKRVEECHVLMLIN